MGPSQPRCHSSVAQHAIYHALDNSIMFPDLSCSLVTLSSSASREPLVATEAQAVPGVTMDTVQSYRAESGH